MDNFRFVKFFRRSIRNKFILVLPLTVIICLGLPFALSIFSLRQQITEHFVKVGKHHINLLEKQFADPTKEKLYEEAVFGHDMLYLEIKDSRGEREFLRTLKDGLQYEHRFTKEIFPKTDSITVKKMVVDGESVLEFTKDVGKEKLIVGISLSALNHLLLQQTVTILLISLLAVGSLIIVIILMSYFITRPVVQLTQETEAIAEGQQKRISISSQKPLDEVGRLAETINHLVGQIDNWEEEAKKMAAEIAFGKVATQVAHDIRGPLSSMQTALGFFGEMKVEDKKFNDVMNLLQLSSKRLTGIADGLLKKHTGREEQAVIFSLHKILDELIGEYHSQYKAITFTKKYPSRSVELHGDPAKLQRVFGNIIKNAAEAMEYKGTVTIKTEIKEDAAVISIADTGPGMSSETLKRVLGGGYTEGKRDGHGIGMTVVRETVKENGGKLTGTSEIGKGTTFFITLPLPAQDQLQIEQITIHVQESDPIIIIKDDPSLREQWRMVLEEKGEQALLCESYEDFARQKITPNISHTAVVDYHFDNSEKTGADILRLLKPQGFTNLYLCTAEYWKPSVQKLAEDLGVTLCPKPLPRIVIASVNPSPQPSPTRGEGAISISSPLAGEDKGEGGKRGYTVLVIDDDEGVRMSWEMVQAKLGINHLHCYPNMEAMKGNGVDLNAVDIAFVDKNIEGSAFSGAAVLSFLKEKCAGKLVLASGENEKELRKNPQFNNADFITQDKVPSSLSKFFN